MGIREELLALKNKDDLIIVADAHEWAKNNPQSALYKHLEWDDKKAGYEYRLGQIRHLISIKIVNHEGERQIFSIKTDRSRPGGGYRELTDILPSKPLREQLLEDALTELERVKHKYQMLHEYAQVWAEIDKASQKRRKTGQKQKSAKQAQHSKV